MYDRPWCDKNLCKLSFILLKGFHNSELNYSSPKVGPYLKLVLETLKILNYNFLRRFYRIENRWDWMKFWKDFSFLACKEFFWRLEVLNDTVHGQRNLEVKILAVQNVFVSWLVICCLLFGWSFKVEHYHYRPLVHIPITDHPFLKDYLTRNEPKLHVLNLLNRQKRYNELIYDSSKLGKSKMENIFVRFKSVCSAFTLDQGSTSTQACL